MALKGGRSSLDSEKKLVVCRFLRFQVSRFYEFWKLVGEDFSKLVVCRFLRFRVGRFVKTKKFVG